MSVVRILPPSSSSSSSSTSHVLIIFFLLSPLAFSLPDDVSLLQFKASLKNTKPLDSTWVDGTSACDDKKPWLGVLCDGDGHVQSIRLSELGVSGEINVDALAKMDSLRALYLGGNALSGPIPPLNKLNGLKNLYIHDNQFSGEIANDFFDKMGNLRKIWISANNFSGMIPESLGKLPNLVEIRLDDNKFSGHIPIIAQSSLQHIDFSDNDLEGKVPDVMLRFGVHSFDGNSGICGKGLENECPETLEEGHPEHHTDPHASSGSGKWVVLGIVVTLLLLTIVFKSSNNDDDFDDFHKENLDEIVPISVHSGSSNRRSGSKKMSESGRWSRKGSQSQHGGRSGGDLVIVNDQRGLFGLQDLMKAAAEVLGNGGLGSAYKAVLATGISVVVKRLREMNKLNKEAFDAEIRRIGKLRHPNVLTPLAYHYRKDEKLFVSEFIPKGSLLYLLHGDRGISHADLNWPTRLKIIQGVARGMRFLHTEFPAHEIPHGNLKSSNILLTTNYEPLLSDYAYYPLITNVQTAQSLFAFKSPEAILYQQVMPKSDVYCLGIIILEIITGKFPAQYLNNQKGGIDLVQWVRSAMDEKREIELIDPEIVNASDCLDQMKKLLHIAVACIENDHQVRLDMKEATRRIEETCV